MRHIGKTNRIHTLFFKRLAGNCVEPHRRSTLRLVFPVFAAVFLDYVRCHITILGGNAVLPIPSVLDDVGRRR